MPQAPDAPLVARYARKRSEQGAYIFVVFLALMAFLAWREAEVKQIVIGMIGCGVLLAFIHFGQRRIQNAHGPQLIVDGTGMLMPEYFVHRVPWEAIARARILRQHERADLLVVDVPKAAIYGPREQKWDRKMREFADSTEFMIDIRDLDVSSLDIEAAIIRFAPGKASPPA
ncbi:MAG: hypothetical protein K2X45_21860 [Phreatobacter sp.]|nr:hypothetical protein [Phreatobacter sp.]